MAKTDMASRSPEKIDDVRLRPPNPLTMREHPSSISPTTPRNTSVRWPQMRMPHDGVRQSMNEETMSIRIAAPMIAKPMNLSREYFNVFSLVFPMMPHYESGSSLDG